ncbi:MAG: hypothetical protein SOS22_08470 [Absicoccus sp.]|uniref:hypothetical protein n=1 Tax=Absicoccus sp. TaxID=2718527 RepID=UPI002A74CC2D|nr:hypothetical protein [Absicoccus sp.]MDY3036235.1 hypothetical protein [Absicoccus sp.]
MHTYTLYVVVDSLESQRIEDVQSALSKLGDFHFSPVRNQDSLIDCSEFYATIQCAEPTWNTLIPQFNAYWSAHDETWMDYGYNTPMFHPDVYYLEIK